MLPYKKPLNIDELDANHYIVSAHKYGFFLCRNGSARILLGSNIYIISQNHLCIYTPNSFFRILERSQDLQGVLEEDDVDSYYPVVDSIDIRSRLQIRNRPCVVISEEDAESIVKLYHILNDGIRCPDARSDSNGTNKRVTNLIHAGYVQHLRYSLCMKVLEVYFGNTPIEAMAQSKGDAILNHFLVSVHENCAKERTVKYYADEQHLTPYYFSTIIRERSGKSAMQWIANITMTYARQYLERSQLSIKEIAELLNFPDQSCFGRYFKCHEGCTPTQYRARTSKSI